jgi:hypothetical protein
MELNSIKGNCSMEMLSGNDDSARCYNTFRDKVKGVVKKCYSPYVMLVTNYYTRRSLYYYLISDFDYIQGRKITKKYKDAGFKKIGNYKNNTTVMVAKSYDIRNL